MGIGKSRVEDFISGLSESDRKLFSTCSEEELELIYSLAQDESESKKELAWEVDFHEKPVSIETFITDPYYLGLEVVDGTGGEEEQRNGIYEAWFSMLREVFHPDRNTSEFILSGSIGTGKCLSKDHLIPCVDRGLITAENLYFDESITHLQSESGPRQILGRHDEGLTQTKRITTKHGHVVEVRPNHRLRVLDGFGLAWKQAQDLQEGDVLVQVPSSCWGTQELPTETAEFLGWAVAEGSFPNDSEVHINLHRDEVQHLQSLRSGGVVVSDSRSDSAVRVSYYDKGLRSLFTSVENLSHCRVADVHSHNIEVPQIIREGSQEAVCAFLRGLFSGDSSIAKSVIELCTMSETLARQVRVLLTSLGIENSVSCGEAGYSTKTVPENPYSGSVVREIDEGYRVTTGTRWRLRIVGLEARRRFLEHIGFVQSYKNEELLSSLNQNRNSDHSFSFRMNKSVAEQFRAIQPKGSGPKTKTPKGKIHRLVAGQRCTVRLLQEIREVGGVLPGVLERIADRELLFDTVQSVEDSSAHCYDFTVEGRS